MVGLLREGSSDSLLNNGPRSEYVKRYQVYPAQKIKSYRPANEVTKSDAPLDSETVFRRDYPEHQLPKRSLARPAGDNLRPEGGQDFRSSYQNEFPERSTERRKPYKPDTLRPELAAFDAQPSYRDDYQEWELPKKHQQGKDQWQPPVHPFESNTTNMNDYKEHGLSPRINHKPINKPIHSDEPFNASSDYKDTYREHPLPAKTQRERDKWTKPQVPLDDMTIQQSDYRGEYAPKQKSMKPEANVVKSDVPIEGDTTSSITYRPHDLTQRYRHQPEKYKQPNGYMDLTTTNSTEFIEHPLQKKNAIKPDSSDILKGYGEMAKDTNYNKDFQEYPIDRVAPIKPNNKYQPPTAPMQSQTEYQADFYERQPGPRQDFKPKYSPLNNNEPIDDRTDYRDKFVEYKITPREQRPREIYKGPSEPLDSRTTARESYLGPYQPKRKAFRPDVNMIRSDDRFDNNTTMSTDFKAYDVKRPERFHADPYTKPDGDIDLLTSHSLHYKEHPLQRQKIERPGSSNLLKGTGEMSSKTNYQGDYIERPIDRQKMFKPNNEYHPPIDLMTSETTHRSHFHEHELQERHIYKPRDNALRSDAPLDDRTGYRDAFIQHEISPRNRRPRELHQPPSDPLDDRTTARDSYQGPVLPKRESFRPHTNVIKSEAPLDGNTTTNTDFRGHQIPTNFLQTRYRPKDEYTKPDIPLDDRTDYRDKFVEHNITPRNPKEQKAYKPPSAPLDSRTTTNQDYIGVYQPKRGSIRPDNQYIKSSAPLESDTTHSAAFQQWPLGANQRSKPEQYVKPDGFMDLTTVNRESYQAIQGDKRQKIQIPSSNILSHHGNFDNSTVYMNDFVSKGLDNRLKVRPENQYTPSAMPFEDKTEYRTAHVGFVAPKEKSLRPDPWSDALGQRDPKNPFHIKPDNDWRHMLKMTNAETVVKG